MRRAVVTATDWLMLSLAVLSIGMLSYETWGNPTAEQTQRILLGDLVIIGIFAIEFSLRWARDERPKSFPLRNWYEILGMIPVAHPAVRGFRLFRIVRIVVILGRFGRAADRAFGEDFTYRLIGKYKGALVDAISGAVTLRVLADTEAVLLKGQYARNMADAIESRGDEMLKLAIEKVKADPEVGRIRHMPFFEEIVGTTGRVSQRIMIDLLRDPRMGDLMRDIIAQNTRQIRDAVRAKEAAQAT